MKQTWKRFLIPDQAESLPQKVSQGVSGQFVSTSKSSNRFALERFGESGDSGSSNKKNDSGTLAEGCESRFEKTVIVYGYFTQLERAWQLSI